MSRSRWPGRRPNSASSRRDAAEAIARAARLELLDRARIDEGFARTGHTIVPLVWELSRVVGEPHGGWVHWGATTQNITQTGDLLVLRQAHRIFLRLIGEALTAMADLAERGADMPMPGRTHGQHAVPATFGYKVAVWIDELLRHVERLRQAAPRLFVAMLGGGAGTYASLGKQGPPVQAGIGRQLGFGTMTVPSRALGDHLAENICLLGLLAATCGKIGREIYTLMKTEFGEVEEPVPPGTVGSSTMPQKRNPKLCQDIIAAAAEVRAMVPLALEAMKTEHEADRTTSLMMDSAEARACIETGDMLARLGEVMRGLRLDPARMRRNLDLGGGLIMAEAVMLDLGATIGRQHAHDVVYDAAQAAAVEGRSFGDLLAADPRVTAHLDAAAIARAAGPDGVYRAVRRDGARGGGAGAGWGGGVVVTPLPPDADMCRQPARITRITRISRLSHGLHGKEVLDASRKADARHRAEGAFAVPRRRADPGGVPGLATAPFCGTTGRRKCRSITSSSTPTTCCWPTVRRPRAIAMTAIASCSRTAIPAGPCRRCHTCASARARRCRRNSVSHATRGHWAWRFPGSCWRRQGGRGRSKQALRH